MTEEVSIDVVILTWNDGDLLAASVGSVLDTTAAQVVVVDNGSEPPAEVVDDPRVRLIRSPTNRGVAGGRNDGVAQTSSDLVCFLDSDAALLPGALDALVAPLREDPHVAVAVPVFADQPPEASAGRAPTLRDKVERVRGRTATYQASPRSADVPWWEVDFGIGACQLIRRSVFDEVGGLDESMYWTEDLDFCLRVRDAGHAVVQVGAARVNHPPRRRYRRPLTRKGLRHSMALLRLMWRHRHRDR